MYLSRGGRMSEETEYIYPDEAEFLNRQKEMKEKRRSK